MRHNLFARSTTILLAATALTTCWCLPAAAQSTWIGAGGTGNSGIWGTAAHWNPNGAPNAVGAEILLNQNPGVGAIIDLQGGTFTIGTMRVNTPTSYLIGTSIAPGTLNFEVGAGNALIEVTQVGTPNALFVSAVNGGSPLTVNLVSNTNATVAAGQRLWFGDNTTLAGAGELIANGAGTVRIDGTSTRTGITRLQSGTLEIGNAGALGTGQLRFTNGTLRANTSGTLANIIGVEANGSMATIVGNGQTVTQTGTIGLGNNIGSLSFGEVGNTGTFVMGAGFASFGGVSTFSVDVLGGTLRGTTNVLGFFTGNAVATNVAAGATLEYLSTGALDSRIRNVQSLGTIVTGTGVTLTLGGGQSAGTITGAGAVRVTADPIFGGAVTGNVQFVGAHTYTGGTTVDAGASLTIGTGGTTGSMVGNVVNNGFMLFARSDVRQFDGAISGTGSIVTSGGTLILTGANSYTGGTVIDTASILQLGNGGTTGSIAGPVNILANGALAFNRSDAVQFDGVISGAGGVRQTGTGALNLTANNTYTGNTTVNAGLLAVNGSIASSALTTVNAGGTLGGNGTVGNTTINAGGALAPGNSIGLLTVQGSLTFAAASSYMVEVSPANADRTNVTGTATLGGATVNTNFAAGSYVERQYTILNAGSISGTFGSLVNTNLPGGFSSSLSYDANNAYLNLEFTLANLNGLNVNQQNVANSLTNFFNTTGGIPLVFGALTPAGLTQVSGEIGTGSQQATFNAMGLFMGLLTDPFIAGRDGGATGGTGAAAFAEDADAAQAYAAKGKRRTTSERDAYAAVYRKAPVMADPFAQRWSVWGAGYGGSQTTDGNPTVGSNDTTSRVYGVAVGADYRFSPYTLAGFALAGGGTNFSIANNLGTGRSDLFQAGAYLRHHVGAAYLSAALAYGWQDITTDRTVTVAGIDQLRAQFNANAWSGRLEGGYRFVGYGVGLTPYAAGQFTTFQLPGYAETVVSGANTFALSYAAKDVTASRSELGLRTDKSFAVQGGIFTLRGRGAWAHNFNTDRSALPTFQALPGASFVVNGAAQARDAALATASAEMKWLNGFSVAGTFEGEFSNVTQSYAGKGVVRYTW